MSKLLSNLPIEDLTPENDYLGIIEKGDMIKNFLLHNTEEFSEIKMFALYGEWGSGKSTLMKYLQKELKGTCNTYFFEAWEFESDSNLPISLLEDLMNKSFSKTNKVSKEILEIAEDLFLGFAKSIRISLPGVSVIGKELIESVKKKPLSFHQSKKEFKANFQKWENLVLKDDPSKFNVVFIDDLDRCEPENVLNLLSALKLFFTYGKKTIFLCGVDKKAVNEAITTKYGDVVKSEEYLEKVFDLSFRMPKKQNLHFLVRQFFSSKEIYRFGGYDKTEAQIVAELLYSLNFRNARRVKKVLNKYALFKSVLKSLPKNHSYKSKAPNLFDQKIVLFDLVFCIYFIILKEFYHQIFSEVSEKDLRLVNYSVAMKSSPKSPSNTDVAKSISYLERMLNGGGFNASKSGIRNHKSYTGGQKEMFKAQIAINFSPVNPSDLTSGAFSGALEFVNGFKDLDKNVDYKFTHYFLGSFEDLIKQDIESAVGISDIYNIVDFII